ncbi:LRR and NB-ARC domain disease resistance protein, partial [Trifolium medium]|nr:LRR and NB-ARC domain disease resistance protein [Trifolium medium]
MASIAVDVVVSVVAKLLIEEYGVLGDTARHVEWIEKELRSMRGLLEQVEHHRYGEQEQAFNEWAEKLKDVALDAKNVIETFVIKSVKRKRWGALHWFDKYYVGKQLEHIRTRMRDISHTGMNLNMNIRISVQAPAPAVGEEAPPPSRSSSSSRSTTIVVAM